MRGGRAGHGFAAACGLALISAIWPCQIAIATQVDTYIAQGKDAVSLRQFKEGEAAFRRGLELEPGHPEALYGAGYCALQQGKFSKALADLENVLRGTYATPAFRSFHMLALSRIGEIRLARKEYKAASEVYAQGVKNDPKSAEFRYGWGVALRAQGRNELALEQFEEALKLDPKSAGSLIGKAAIYYELGNVPEAFRLLEQAESAAPANPLPYGVMSGFYRDMKKPMEHHLALGHYYFYAGNLQRAANEYRTAQAIKETPESHHVLGAAYLQLGQLSEAEAQLRQALKMKIEPAETTWAQLSRVLARGGKLGEADQALDKAIALNKKVPAFEGQRAWIRILQGRFDEADKLARSAIERDAAAAAPYRYLGDSLSARGRFKDAIDAYEKSLARDPTQSDVYVNLGWAFESTGDPVSAQRNYEFFLRASPTADEARDVRAQLNKLKKKQRKP